MSSWVKPRRVQVAQELMTCASERRSPGRRRPWRRPPRLACELPFEFRPPVAGIAQPAKRLPPKATCVVGTPCVDRANESVARAAVCALVRLRSGHYCLQYEMWRGTVYSRGWPAVWLPGMESNRSLESTIHGPDSQKF